MEAVRLAEKRNLSIDLLKAIAIIGVITIHTSSAGYQNAVGSFDWCGAVFWGSLTRASVPLFFMCSGALLLDPARALTLSKLYKKNLLRIVAALFFWAAAYKIYGLLLSDSLNGAALLYALKELVLFRHEFHLYYLHIILLVYAFLPVTRVFIKHASEKELRYFLALWFVLGIVYPVAVTVWPFTLLSGIPLQWLMNMTYASIGYGVAGAYLQKHAAVSPGAYLLLAAAGFAGVFGGTVLLSVRQGRLYETLLEGMSPGVALMAVGIFGYITARLKKDGAKINGRLFSYLSNASFCIYLVHVFYLYALNSLGLTAGPLPCLISIPVTVAVNFCLSAGTYFLLSHIPVVRNYLI